MKMKTKTASTLLFLAAAIVGGVSCQRATRDGVVRIPLVGISPMGPSTVSTSNAESTTTTTTTAEDEEELVKALEFEGHVTVVSPIEVGELLCDTLVEAEDAAFLSVVLLHNEVITAERLSYTVTNGNTFTGGIGRKVWTGVVTDPAQGEDETVPRTVSMAWADKCDCETFLLKVTKQSVDGTTSIVKTVPCYGLTTHTCLLEVDVEFDEPNQGISPPVDTSRGSAISRGDGEGNTAHDRPTGVSSSSNRQLQDDGDTVLIDVMVLYSSQALVHFGDISSDQMETNIIESIARTNEAFVNSEVALSFNAVHIGPLPYEQRTTDTESELRTLTHDFDAENLRNETGADLVQMVGSFNDGNCGRAFLYEGGDAVYGTSVVGAWCLDDNTVAHEFGHNLGCLHNRENATYPTDYAHGVRYCNGDDPYRTIMSYWCGHGPYVNYFSNPDVSYLGKPTGTTTENNARAIRDNMVEISNFRNRVDAAAPTPAQTTAPSVVAPTTAPTTAPFSVAAPTPAPTTALSTTYELLGCYGDDTTNRVLTGRSAKGDTQMTTEVCAEFCIGSPFFGTEYGTECFCGGASDDPTELGDASCTFACAGDASQTCGGPSAITVYEYDTVATRPGYLGCWEDTKAIRIMNAMESDSSMTNDLCDELCSSYPFYGTQHGQECWCGDESTDHTTHGESDLCKFECAGDASQTCGGSYAMSVYEHDTTPPPPPPAGYLGCWEDSKDGRIMGVMESSSSMTNDVCAEICSSYAFYGTQYGKECWCGDESADFTAYGESDLCNMRCTGNAAGVCGGRYAMSVWEINK